MKEDFLEEKVQWEFRGNSWNKKNWGNIKMGHIITWSLAWLVFQKSFAFFFPSSYITSCKIILQTNAKTSAELFIRTGYWCRLEGGNNKARNNNVIEIDHVKGHKQKQVHRVSRDLHPQESSVQLLGSCRSLLENSNSTWRISCTVLLKILFIISQPFL